MNKDTDQAMIAAVMLLVLALVTALLTMGSSVTSTVAIGRAMLWGFAILAGAALFVSYFGPRLRQR